MWLVGSGLVIIRGQLGAGGVSCSMGWVCTLNAGVVFDGCWASSTFTSV